MKQKGNKTLKGKLVMLVVLCWVVPLLSIFSVLAYDMNTNRDKQLTEEYITEIRHRASLVILSLEEAVASSRQASYDGILHSLYSTWEKDKDALPLSGGTNQYLASQYRYNPAFVTTVLFYHNSPEQRYYTYNATNIGSYGNYLDYVSNVHDAVTDISATLATSIEFLAVDQQVYMIRNLVDSDFNPFATLVMELNMDLILSPFLTPSWQTGGSFLINDSLYQVGDSNKISNHFPSPSGTAILERQGTQHLLHGRNVSDSFNLEYVITVEDSTLLKQLAPYSIVLFILIGILIILLLIVVNIGYQNIFEPLERLVKASKAIEDGDFGYQVTSMPHNQELIELTESINHMSLHLRQQFERIYTEELASRDAKIMALQSQINPHFLNNTLEIINWEARLQGNEKVSHMIEALSVMLEAVTEREPSKLITLEQELEYINAYLYIVTMRFGDRITISKEIDPSLLSYQVPRFILQPIVENAVEHGMPGGKDCEIMIGAFQLKDYLVLEIMNDSPLSQENKETIEVLLSPTAPKEKYTTKMGIYNVNARLRMLYADEGWLEITSNETHTTATLLIPL